VQASHGLSAIAELLVNNVKASPGGRVVRVGHESINDNRRSTLGDLLPQCFDTVCWASGKASGL